MLDPGAIGTIIIWLESEKRSEADIERTGLVVATQSRTTDRRPARRLSRWLRAIADRLEPPMDDDTSPARTKETLAS